MKKRNVYAGALIVACCVSHGAGFQVLEQGASNIGSALAGATANASSDASAAFWNPSAAIFSEKIGVGEIDMESGLNFVVPNFEFHNQGTTGYRDLYNMSGGEGGNAGEIAYVPNFYSVYRFHEDFAFTFSTTATYGLETDYDEGWVGRYHALNSDLTTIDVNPSLAYKVNDWLSISAGASLNWMHAYLTQNVFTGLGSPDAKLRVSGDGWSAGANVGFTIKYAEGGKFGVSWRSEVSHDLGGNAEQIVLGTSAYKRINCDLTLPQTVNAGIYQRLWGDLDRFAVMLDYSWTGWSAFEYLNIKYSDGSGTVGGRSVYENWKDTSRVAFGIHYYPEFDKNMVIRFGTAWDESPVRKASFRTARIPCTDRVWLSCGLGYQYDKFNFNLGYTYILFLEDPSINNASPSGLGTMKGYFTGMANVVSVQVGMKW